MFARRSKYRNVKVIVDGMTFDSKAEAQHWSLLKRREVLGEIRNLRRQVTFPLIPAVTVRGKTWRGISYVADFVYDEDGEEKIIDVKGFRTDVYKIKLRLMKFLLDKDVTEVA